MIVDRPPGRSGSLAVASSHQHVLHGDPLAALLLVALLPLSRLLTVARTNGARLSQVLVVKHDRLAVVIDSGVIVVHTVDDPYFLAVSLRVGIVNAGVAILVLSFFSFMERASDHRNRARVVHGLAMMVQRQR